LSLLQTQVEKVIYFTLLSFVVEFPDLPQFQSDTGIALGSAAVLLIGFLEGAIIGNCVESEGNSLARAEAVAAASSSSKRLIAMVEAAKQRTGVREWMFDVESRTSRVFVSAVRTNICF
jgi:hypothetical protein